MAASKLQGSSLALWIRFAKILHCNKSKDTIYNWNGSVWVCMVMSKTKHHLMRYKLNYLIHV